MELWFNLYAPVPEMGRCGRFSRLRIGSLLDEHEATSRPSALRSSFVALVGSSFAALVEFLWVCLIQFGLTSKAACPVVDSEA